MAGCGRESSFTDGYSDHFSYNKNESVKLFLSSLSGGNEPIDLNVHNVLGKPVKSFSASISPQRINNQTPWENGFGFDSNATLSVTDLPTGVYTIENKIPFVVKDDPAGSKDIVVLYPSNTSNAYNNAGGKSLYYGDFDSDSNPLPNSEDSRARAVSFQRPFVQPLYIYTRGCLKWFWTDVPMKSHFRYISDYDMEDFAQLQHAKILIIIGHSEYWTRQARINFDLFVAQGGHVIVLSGNNMWWQSRLVSGGDQEICYKNENEDPTTDPLLKTINWNSSTLQMSIESSLGADFNLGGFGLRQDIGWDGYRIVAPNNPLFEGTGIHLGDIISNPSSEYDGAPLLIQTTPEGYPILDTNALGFSQVELLGYDYGSRNGQTTVGTMIVFQKTLTSGIVLNTASTGICRVGIDGKDAAIIKKVLSNAITKMYQGDNVF